MNKGIEGIKEAIKTIESRLRIPDGFVECLLNEDDWSFVIKAHALLEAVCSEILTTQFGSSMGSIFSRLELGNKETGKVAFLKALEFLKDDERRFVSEFSILRNQLVHNVKNTSFAFDEYLKTIDKNNRKKFVDAFGYAYAVEDDSGKITVSDRDRVIREPKVAIWESLKWIIAIISLQIDKIHLDKKIQTLSKELAHLKK